MLFNSIEFLIFFPLVTMLFFAFPHPFRWAWLLIASCVFYLFFIRVYIFILIGTILIDYTAGLLIERSEGRKRKAFLILSLAANIGVLAVFKYYNFFVDTINSLSGISLSFLNILLPIGLSFHTFQAMSYTIEVYRGDYPAEKHLGIYALYVMFYPQLVAGPIERPQHLLPQLHKEHRFNPVSAASGLRLMMWGMFKKVVIADRLAQFVDPVFSHPQSYPAITLAAATFFFAIQIFCDFSGYTDIAIGAARVMGFKIMTNFNKPYHARSISEFWKRWHISLSTWFRDYLYIPLGGNRVSVSQWCLIILFVFIVSGFWHGANWTFLIWGGLHGMYMVLARMSRRMRNYLAVKIHLMRQYRLHNMLKVVFVFLLVCFAWIFFRANNVHDAFYIVQKLCMLPSDMMVMLNSHSFALLHTPLPAKEIYICLLCILLLELVHIVQVKTDVTSWLYRLPVHVRWFLYYCCIASIYFFGVLEKHQFIYFQF